MTKIIKQVADYLEKEVPDLYDEIYNRGYKDGFDVDKKDEINQVVEKLIKLEGRKSND